MNDIPPNKPVLITGATASGKSQLALQFAKKYGGIILNADAMQVYKNWRILTARPSRASENKVAHRLYGHVNKKEKYSVGRWLSDISSHLIEKNRPIIVGGTGLYLTALTEGISKIPQIPEEISIEAKSRFAKEGLSKLLNEIDPITREKIDVQNPMRVMRAWEVEKFTKTPLYILHLKKSSQPLLKIEKSFPILIEVPKEITTSRITKRLDQMLQRGVIEEVRENLRNWDPDDLSSKALGAKDLLKVINKEISLDEAKKQIIIATRQYAKRQRAWFKKRMRVWHKVYSA